MKTGNKDLIKVAGGFTYNVVNRSKTVSNQLEFDWKQRVPASKKAGIKSVPNFGITLDRSEHQLILVLSEFLDSGKSSEAVKLGTFEGTEGLNNDRQAINQKHGVTVLFGDLVKAYFNTDKVNAQYYNFVKDKLQALADKSFWVTWKETRKDGGYKIHHEYERLIKLRFTSYYDRLEAAKENNTKEIPEGLSEDQLKEKLDLYKSQLDKHLSEKEELKKQEKEIPEQLSEAINESTNWVLAYSEKLNQVAEVSTFRNYSRLEASIEFNQVFSLDTFQLIPRDTRKRMLKASENLNRLEVEARIKKYLAEGKLTKAEAKARLDQIKINQELSEGTITKAEANKRLKEIKKLEANIKEQLAEGKLTKAEAKIKLEKPTVKPSLFTWDYLLLWYMLNLQFTLGTHTKATLQSRKLSTLLNELGLDNQYTKRRERTQAKERIEKAFNILKEIGLIKHWERVPTKAQAEKDKPEIEFINKKKYEKIKYSFTISETFN